MLEGYRVVELAAWVAGPAAGGILADWGADVVKVEPPSGDPQRRIFGALGIDVAAVPPFELDNRGKRSVLLDLRTAHQYQREERTLLLQRAVATQPRLDILLDTMAGDTIAPQANVITLRRGLAEHFQADVFLKCESMAALVRENLRQIRLADAQGRHAAGASWGVSR